MNTNITGRKANQVITNFTEAEKTLHQKVNSILSVMNSTMRKFGISEIPEDLSWAYYGTFRKTISNFIIKDNELSFTVRDLHTRKEQIVVFPTHLLNNDPWAISSFTRKKIREYQMERLLKSIKEAKTGVSTASKEGDATKTAEAQSQLDRLIKKHTKLVALHERIAQRKIERNLRRRTNKARTGELVSS